MISERAFCVALETLEPFRIGGVGDPLAAADNPVAIVGSQAAIPGSSLKGALRAQIEQHLIGQFYDRQTGRWQQNHGGAQPCMAATQVSRDERALIERGLYRSDQLRAAPGCHYPCNVGDRARCGHERHTICPVCYLLGAQGVTGFVRVPFLFSDVAPDQLYSARMNRATRTVSEQTNRSYQLIPHGTTFRGTMYLTLEDDVLGWSLGKPRPLGDNTGGDAWLGDGSWTRDRLIKELVTDRLEGINLLGGYKSKGFGRVKIKVTPV